MTNVYLCGLRRSCPPHSRKTWTKGRFKNAAEYACETAVCKAREVASRQWEGASQPDLIIGADTVVELHGDILEKPSDAGACRGHACQVRHACITWLAFAAKICLPMRLKLHIDNAGSVARHTECHTGVALVLPSPAGTAEGLDMHSFSCTTAVEFDALTPGDIKAYISSGGHAGALPAPHDCKGGCSHD